ncbi:MAG TPA: CmcI family methyltransferase [Thermoanaerobaculia bacterium]
MARPLRRLARTLHGWVEPGLSALLAGVSRRLKLSLVSTRSQEQDAALAWTRLLWQNQLWRSNRWYGVPLLQWPTDLLVLQELVYDLRPKVIVETGTFHGGGAVFFASLLKLFDIEGGRVVSVDIHLSSGVAETVARHPLGNRITLVEASSTSPEALRRVEEIVAGETNVLVFLDSDHSYRHVLDELRAYQKFVPVGGYLCAFDTIMKDLHDLPLGEPSWKDDNPHRAVLDFLAENRDFEIDREKNRLRVGFAPDGFLRRVR